MPRIILPIADNISVVLLPNSLNKSPTQTNLTPEITLNSQQGFGMWRSFGKKEATQHLPLEIATTKSAINNHDPLEISSKDLIMQLEFEGEDIISGALNVFKDLPMADQ